MGTSPIYYGAIRVTPKVNVDICLRLNMILALRHSRLLDAPEMRPYCKPAWAQKDAPRIPSIKAAKEEMLERHKIDVTVAPHLIYPDDAFLDRYDHFGATPDEVRTMPQEEVNKIWGMGALYSKRQFDDRSLYSCIRIVQPVNQSCSYIMWNDSEKATGVYGWLKYLVDTLADMRYTCKGTILVHDEEEPVWWHIRVKCNEVAKNEGIAMPTYFLASKIERRMSEQRAAVKEEKKQPESEKAASMPIVPPIYIGSRRKRR